MLAAVLIVAVMPSIPPVVSLFDKLAADAPFQERAGPNKNRIPCDIEFPVNTVGNYMGKKKPVVAEEKDSEKYWLYIIGAPFTGTSSIYSILSTSPEASNLCPRRGRKIGNCEGAMMWIQSNIVSKSRMEFWEGKPLNWTWATDEMYPRNWNTSKQVLLEKSPPTVMRVPEIWAHLRNRKDRKVRFLFVSMSPCRWMKDSLRGRRRAEGWYAMMDTMIKSMNMLPPSTWIHVRTEDVFRDAEKEMRRILRWMPALQSLDTERAQLGDR
eukprot:Hpha_TRINITY_DN16036_c1_g4::TRINITY_DN16036_c1_g4_i1::g.120594::m.120594